MCARTALRTGAGAGVGTGFHWQRLFRGIQESQRGSTDEEEQKQLDGKKGLGGIRDRPCGVNFGETRRGRERGRKEKRRTREWEREKEGTIGRGIGRTTGGREGRKWMETGRRRMRDPSFALVCRSHCPFGPLLSDAAASPPGRKRLLLRDALVGRGSRRRRRTARLLTVTCHEKCGQSRTTPLELVGSVKGHSSVNFHQILHAT